MSTNLFHVQFGLVQRSAGNDARKASAYQRCAIVERRDGKPFDFRRKRNEHAGHTMLLPPNAPAWAADPAELWQRAEDAEKRGDAQVARTVVIAIPREVPADQRMGFVRAIVQPWTDQGMAAQVDLHCTRAADGEEQPHAHILLTMRRLDGGGFAKKKEREWNAAFRENDGRAMRGAVADRMNQFMAQQKIGARVDHRSHAEQGLDGPPPERDAPKKTWKAYQTAPDTPAADPVKQVLGARRKRQKARQDIAWETARAAYAAAAAQHYASEKERRTAAYTERRQAEHAARADMQARQRDDRNRVYQRTHRGFVRDLHLAIKNGQHERDRAALDTRIQTNRLTGAPTNTPFPALDAWLDERAAQGDQTAKAALDQCISRRAWLAKKDPAAAARRNLADAERAADQVLRGRPPGSVDAQELFAAARNKITARRDQVAAAAQAAQQAVEEHRRAAGFLRRLTDPTWQAEHARLTGISVATQKEANRIAGRYDREMQIAREAAREAATENRRTLAAWLVQPEVQAAQTAAATAARVRAALDAGDKNTIQAAAAGDLPAAAQAARAAEERQEAEVQRLREQMAAQAAEERRAAEERAQEAARTAEAARSAARQQIAAAPTPSPSPGFRM